MSDFLDFTSHSFNRKKADGFLPRSRFSFFAIARYLNFQRLYLLNMGGCSTCYRFCNRLDHYILHTNTVKQSHINNNVINKCNKKTLRPVLVLCASSLNFLCFLQVSTFSHLLPILEKMTLAGSSFNRSSWDIKKSRKRFVFKFPRAGHVHTKCLVVFHHSLYKSDL